MEDEISIEQYEIVDQIVVFIRKGEVLLREARGNSLNPQIAEDWGEEVLRYLKRQLGSSFTSRFVSDVGAPNTVLTGANTRSSRAWSYLNNRLYRLQQFIPELSRR